MPHSHCLLCSSHPDRLAVFFNTPRSSLLQGLCGCCFLGLECSFSRNSHGCLTLIFQSLSVNINVTPPGKSVLNILAKIIHSPQPAFKLYFYGNFLHRTSHILKSSVLLFSASALDWKHLESRAIVSFHDFSSIRTVLSTQWALNKCMLNKQMILKMRKKQEKNQRFLSHLFHLMCHK